MVKYFDWSYNRECVFDFESETPCLRAGAKLSPAVWRQKNKSILHICNFSMIWVKSTICMSKWSKARFCRFSMKVRKVRFWTAQRTNVDISPHHGSVSALLDLFWSQRSPLKHSEASSSLPVTPSPVSHDMSILDGNLCGTLQTEKKSKTVQPMEVTEKLWKDRK